MEHLDLVLQHGLFYGVILSAVMTAFIFCSLRYNPEIWLHDAPAEIQARVGPMSSKAKRQRLAWVILMFAVLAILVGWSLAQLKSLTGGELRFVDAFLSVLVTFMTFNLWDLVVIDWLIVVTIQPRWVVLPGTEGMASYKDYRFHFDAFLKGSAGIVIGSLVIAGLAALVA